MPIGILAPIFAGRQVGDIIKGTRPSQPGGTAGNFAQFSQYAQEQPEPEPEPTQTDNPAAKRALLISGIAVAALIIYYYASR